MIKIFTVRQQTTYQVHKLDFFFLSMYIIHTKLPNTEEEMKINISVWHG